MKLFLVGVGIGGWMGLILRELIDWFVDWERSLWR